MNVAVSVNQIVPSLNSESKIKPNKHGKFPYRLSPLNGVLPENSGLLDGTVAEGLGLRNGIQAVLNISFRGYYVDPKSGTKYPNYDYTVVTVLGNGFEQLVAQKVVESMDFGFGTGRTPTPTPVPQQEIMVQGSDEIPSATTLTRGEAPIMSEMSEEEEEEVAVMPTE